MPEVKRTRESWLDACKGIAIILVVIGHIIDGNMAKGAINGLAWTIIYNEIYLFHMPLFFVLSGMALAISNRKNLAGGGIESCCNLLILYLFWSTFMYVFRTILSTIVNVVPEKSLIVSLLFYPVGPYWYIYVLMFYYLIFYLILNKINKIGHVIVGSISIALSVILPSWFINRNVFEGRSYEFLYHFIYFLIGYISCYYKDKIIIFLKDSYIMPILSALTVAIYIFANDIIKIPGVKLIMTCLVISGILSLVLKCRFISENKILCYFGQNSIYIYLIHNYITVALRAAYIALGMVIPSIIYFVLCLIVTLALCVLAIRITAKVWILDIFFKPVKTWKKLYLNYEKKV